MDNVLQSFRSIASPRYIILGTVAIALLIVFSLLSLRLTSPVMTTLYSNLNANDSSAVVTELGRLGVKFDVTAGGSEIQVESSDVLKVRMMLAEKGLPSQASIVGYEIFDKESVLGTSNFVMNVNLVRALEGELARTITALGSIKSARVHLVIPRKDVFKRSDYEPSASVVLTLNNRLDVPKEEAMAVKHLVSSSVPGLSPAKVTIVDSNGKILARAKSTDDDGFSSTGGASEFKFQMEERLQGVINSLLEQAVGAGKVETEVSVDVSVERISVSSETYDPDGQVIRSTQTSEQLAASTSAAGGQVSVANELTGENAEGGGNNENNQQTNEVTNYEISKTITSKVNDGGQINKISVAVLVDGKYSKDASGNDVYIPRGDEEMDQIRALVRSAIGFDEKRGDKVEVVNMQFSRESSHLLAQEGPFDWLMKDLDSIIKTVVLGVVAILVIMLVVKPLVNKAFDVSASDLEAEETKAMAEQEKLLKMMQTAEMPEIPQQQQANEVIQSRANFSAAQKVNEIIDGNPEETLMVLRSWLAQKG